MRVRARQGRSREIAIRVVRLRSERDYSATFYDPCSAAFPSSLPLQIGPFYDLN